MADCVDAPVKAMEAPDVCALRDTAPPVPEAPQLPGRHHSMLRTRKIGQLPMTNPLSFVHHRFPKDRGFPFSPPLGR